MHSIHLLKTIVPFLEAAEIGQSFHVDFVCLVTLYRRVLSSSSLQMDKLQILLLIPYFLLTPK